MKLPTLEEYLSGERKSLGWEILQWGSEMLGQPDRGPKGEPWVYSPEQALFILRFYEVDPNGRFTYRRAVLERPKGWGKSPLLAAICCTEAFGPCRFDGWDADGNPVGRPEPSALVQIAAISDSQANNTMDMVSGMLIEGNAIYDIPGLDPMMSKVTSAEGQKIEKVTASPRGREGNRTTFVVMDETHLWVPAEKGPELFRALRRNVTKMTARTIETTNAHVPGELSVAESSYNACLELLASGGTNTILFDTKEAKVHDLHDEDAVMAALSSLYGEALKTEDNPDGWVDPVEIWAEINDPSIPETVTRRFWFNEKLEGSATWLTADDMRACEQEDLILNVHGQKFALGFKGAIRNGSAALVACRLEDSALFLLGLWEKPDKAPPDWEVPFAEVDTRVRKYLAMDECFKLIADPENWQEIIGRWYADYPEKVEEEWLTKNRAKATKFIEQFETAAKSRRLSWSDLNLRRHILNSHRADTPQGDIIRKESPKSTRYIDAAQAAVLSLESSVRSIEEGALNEEDFYIYSF